MNDHDRETERGRYCADSTCQPCLERLLADEERIERALDSVAAKVSRANAYLRSIGR